MVKEALQIDTSTSKDADEESGGGQREMDAELGVIGQMVRLLDKLEAPAQARILHYLGLRYNCMRIERVQ